MKRYAIVKIKLLSIVFLFFIMNMESLAQSNCKRLFEPFVGTRQSLFGVKLQPASIKLLEDVEKISGKYLIEYSCTEIEGSVIAYSEIDEEGNPYIVLSEARALNEDSIVHELFHLRLILNGFPKLKTCGHQYLDSELSVIANIIRQSLNSALHHWVFYPTMRQMGLSPQDGYAKLATRTEKDDWVYQTSNFHREERIMLYFSSNLEISDPSIISKLNNWYKSKNWDHELNTGQEMIDIVKNTDLSNTQNTVTMLRKCFNKLENDKFSFKLGNITSEREANNKRAFVCLDIASIAK